MDERSLMLSVSFCSKMHDVWIRGWPEPLHRVSGHSWGPGNRVYHRNGKSALDSIVKTSSTKVNTSDSNTALSQAQNSDASSKKLNLNLALPRLKQNPCILLYVDLKWCLKSLSSVLGGRGEIHNWLGIWCGITAYVADRKKAQLWKSVDFLCSSSVFTWMGM